PAFAAVDFALAVGQIGADAFSGIVVAALGTSGWEAINYIAQLNVGLAQVDVNLALPPEMVNGVGPLAGAQSFNSAQGGQWDFNLAMALGDFSGQSVRVGPPTHYAFDMVNNIIAVLNAPPTETNINYNGSASLMFSDTQMQN